MKKEPFLNADFTSQQLRNEFARVKNKSGAKTIIRNVILLIIAVAAVVSILVTQFFPIMSIRGHSMSPNLNSGSIVISVKTEDIKHGDVCCFYSGNTALCKRIIAVGGEVVNINEEGLVYVNNELIDEPYIAEFALGESDIVYPYLVPENTYFVMGDDRAESIDSRSSQIGCVAKGQVIGKVVFQIWPISGLGTVK